ncbi:hypothetical protein [Halovulum sp. GXIMD14793]
MEVSFSDNQEILVRSLGLFAEYLGDPAATAAAKTDEGWFHTGDIGHLGTDGHLRVVDRIAHVGKLSDGTAFVPRPLENRLKFTAYIREAVAIGDDKPFVSLLIDINTASVSQWANLHGVTFTGHADLAQNAKVGAMIGDLVAQVNADPGCADDVACGSNRHLCVDP